MKKSNKIFIISNYGPDKQESMIRFTVMLKEGLQASGLDVHVISPVVFLGVLAKSTVYGYGKWLGYIDKWMLFPLLLLFRGLFNRKTLFHISDHSNAPYVSWLPKQRTSITCHDVLAIRGALGFQDAYCPASSTGVILQKWILKNLLKAEKIAAVSQLTLDHLTLLNGGQKKTGWTLIHNGFNADFNDITAAQSHSVIQAHNYEKLLEKPFIIHVGSDLPRKNRKMLLNMVAALGQKWDGNICFAGYLMDDELRQLANSIGLGGRIIEIKRPDHKLLEAIINAADAFVFPSFSEGFGWPLIEAQACGTPVIASSLAPMPEVGGNGALYADPYKPEDFAAQFLYLKSLTPEQRDELVFKGKENTIRFNTVLMTERYINFLQIS